jgi:hypothetical protein
MLTPGWHRVTADLVRIRGPRSGEIAFRSWGDWVDVVSADADGADVAYVRRDGKKVTGRIKGKVEKALVPAGSAKVPKVLRLDFVDVQQGDAAVLETPGGQVMLVDGGESQMFARYLAARYPRSTAEKPQQLACIVVTHGDADHFEGLSRIAQSEKDANERSLFVHPERVFHNGLVKGPGKLPDAEMFGATAKVGKRTVVTDLHDDPRTVPTTVMNAPFKTWKGTLAQWTARGPIMIERLERGSADKFGFLAEEGIDVQVLGPVPIGTGAKRGLPLLSTPPPRIGAKPKNPATNPAPSASHTINGHSVVLLVRYGNVRFLLAGDLNEEVEKQLVADHEAGLVDLTAEVLKVPHHGSADYAEEFLGRVAPVVSVVSSGDESEAKEYIHPRATLMGSLGRHARGDVAEPVVFVTELAAFFSMLGPVTTKDGKKVFGFERSAYGIVHCRTDGKRLLVYTHSGKEDQKEAYAFVVGADGTVTPDKVAIY